jgi:hypothetical protein
MGTRIRKFFRKTNSKSESGTDDEDAGDYPARIKVNSGSTSAVSLGSSSKKIRQKWTDVKDRVVKVHGEVQALSEKDASSPVRAQFFFFFFC